MEIFPEASKLSELTEHSGGLSDDPWIGWNITYNDPWVQGLSYFG